MDTSTVRTKVHVEGLMLIALSFQTLGIIYSDIGTSPLYVLNGIWPPAGNVPSKEDVIGGISAIVWSLTLLPLFKYICIAFYFGTSEGEGGTFALFHGLYPPKLHNINDDRTLTGETLFPGMHDDNPKKPKMTFMQYMRWPLMIWAMFGTSLTIADGILTPAVSVTSAVGGIAVAKPNVEKDVIPISIAFLVALFLIQQFGTSRIAFTFAPVAFVWMGLLGVTGIVNIIKFPGIFRAFDPSRAVELFVRTKDYSLLSGVLLAVTGCEAVFANLGQFNAASIRISFTFLVYPCLVLAYLGQGSRLITDGADVLPNVFYLTIPGQRNGPLFWIVYVFAILATLIASQAMITATFSLVQQVINMRSLPPLRMHYTSDYVQGQIYIPVVNWLLMIATVVFVAAFGSSLSLTNAYGFAVATVMFTTSVLITFQIPYVKRLPVIVAIAYFVPFGFFDGIFWGAALKKVPNGAWVPLMVGLILLVLMVFWTWAKGLEDRFDGENRKNLRQFIVEGRFGDLTGSDTGNNNIDEDQDDKPNAHLRSKTDSEFIDNGDDHDNYVDITDTDIAVKNLKKSSRLTGSLPMTNAHDVAQESALYYIAQRSPRSSLASASEKGFQQVDGPGAAVEERRELVRINTCAIFHKLTPGRGVPHSFIGFIRQWPALPRVVIFLSVCIMPVPRVGLEDRFQVSKVRTISGFYGVTYCLGYRDSFDVKVQEIMEHIIALERSIPGGSPQVIARLAQDSSFATHIVPHYHVVSKQVRMGRLSPIFTWVRRFLIESIFRRIETMFPETANWLASADEIIHVGINAVI